MTPKYKPSYQKYAKPVRYLFIVAGSIFLALASLGLLLPILPTTPFLLLATACYIRSSKTLYDKVMQNRVFGTYLTNYEQRAMRSRDKKVTITMMWIGMLFSAFFIEMEWVKIILIFIATGVTLHLSRLKSLP